MTNSALVYEPECGGTGGVAGVSANKYEAEFLDEIQTKVLKAFLFVIHSHLYSFALRSRVLKTNISANSKKVSAIV